MRLRHAISIGAALTFAGAALAAHDEPKPLFAASEPLRLTISGPIGKIAADRVKGDTNDATLKVAGSGVALPVKLSSRGITRRSKDICKFPPLRVEFADKPPADSPFRGQKKLKLVTHCQPDTGSEQQLLLEYAAYRMYNLLTPKGFLVRLAAIDYVDPANRTKISRPGYFIEDAGDTAHRTGLHEAKMPDRIPASTLSPADAARFAVFEYMIGNLDWAVNGGPPGAGCCHNAKLIGEKGSNTGLVPVPYDFDYSGLVDAPYATAPQGIKLPNVRVRRYRGFCATNAEAQAAAADIYSRRAAIVAVLGSIPGLDARRQGKAQAYLNMFFDQVATPEGVSANLLKTCLH